MRELISVIVPVYGVEAYLDECVASIVAQTYDNLEIILVDDGSPDNCPAMCDRWAKKDSRIRVIHKENGGLSDARNAGLEIATGEYIAFVDSDDWIEPQMYETLYHAMKAENADMVSCNMMIYYSDHKASRGYETYTVGKSEHFLSLLYDDTIFPVVAWNKLYRRNLWEEIRFPVGKICEDAFTTYLLVHRADKIVHIPEPMYCYRIRQNSIMTSPFSQKRMDEEESWRCNYEFMQQHYPKLYRAAFDFYLQKVKILIYTIPAEQRDDFREEYQYLYGILKKHMPYVLFKSRLPWKARIVFLIDFLNMEKVEKKHDD